MTPAADLARRIRRWMTVEQDDDDADELFAAALPLVEAHDGLVAEIANRGLENAVLAKEVTFLRSLASGDLAAENAALRAKVAAMDDSLESLAMDDK